MTLCMSQMVNVLSEVQLVNTDAENLRLVTVLPIRPVFMRLSRLCYNVLHILLYIFEKELI